MSNKEGRPMGPKEPERPRLTASFTVDPRFVDEVSVVAHAFYVNGIWTIAKLHEGNLQVEIDPRYQGFFETTVQVFNQNGVVKNPAVAVEVSTKTAQFLKGIVED